MGPQVVHLLGQFQKDFEGETSVFLHPRNLSIMENNSTKKLQNKPVMKLLTILFTDVKLITCSVLI